MPSRETRSPALAEIFRKLEALSITSNHDSETPAQPQSEIIERLPGPNVLSPSQEPATITLEMIQGWSRVDVYGSLCVATLADNQKKFFLLADFSEELRDALVKKATNQPSSEE